MANCLYGNHPELRLDIIEHAVLADTQFPNWQFLILWWLYAYKELAIARHGGRLVDQSGFDTVEH